MDRIDERNFREKISRSIIKRNNIHYISQEELNRRKEAEEMDKAQEIIDRLHAEAAQDEMEKQLEIAEAVKESARKQYYNPATKAYSGEYGRQEIADQVEKEKIDKILSEKDEELYRTIEENKSNGEEKDKK